MGPALPRAPLSLQAVQVEDGALLQVEDGDLQAEDGALLQVEDGAPQVEAKDPLPAVGHVFCYSNGALSTMISPMKMMAVPKDEAGAPKTRLAASKTRLDAPNGCSQEGRSHDEAEVRCQDEDGRLQDEEDCPCPQFASLLRSHMWDCHPESGRRLCSRCLP